MPPGFIKKIELGFKETLRLPYNLILRKGKQLDLPIDQSRINSMLILRPDKLGDMIITIPVIHAVKEMYPHIKIDVVASPRNKIVVEQDPQIDNVYLYIKNITKDWPMIQSLKKKHYDLIYDPICYDSTTNLLLAHLIGKNSIIAGSRKDKFFNYYDYTERFLYDGKDHNIDNSMILFNLFGVDPDTVSPFHSVYLPEASKARASEFISSIKEEDKPLIGVNISAGSPTRTMPAEKYIEMIERIGGNHPDFKFVIFCIMPERPKAERIKGEVNHEITIIPKNLSLLDAAAIIQQMNLFISPDTSMVHIARLMKIPVVGLYSGHKRNFNWWRPYKQKHGAVVSSRETDIYDITPAQIADEFELLFEEIKVN